jgi:hypothetical protein
MHFFFKPSYWLGSKDKVTKMDNNIEIGQIEPQKFGFEQDPSELNTTISIQNMTKVLK